MTRKEELLDKQQKLGNAIRQGENQLQQMKLAMISLQGQISECEHWEKQRQEELVTAE